MEHSAIVKKTQKILENSTLSPAEKTLILRLFFRYNFDEFEAKIDNMAVKFDMNRNTLINNLTRLKRAGFLVSKPVYSENGAGRCGTSMQLKKF